MVICWMLKTNSVSGKQHQSQMQVLHQSKCTLDESQNTVNKSQNTQQKKVKIHNDQSDFLEDKKRPPSKNFPTKTEKDPAPKIIALEKP